MRRRRVIACLVVVVGGLCHSTAQAALSAADLCEGVLSPANYLPLGRELPVTVRATEMTGGAFELHGWIGLNNVERESVWNVLTDFGRMHEVIPTIETSELVSASDSSAVVDHEGLATFVLQKTLRFRMEYVAEPPWNVRFEQIEGDLGAFSGSWEITPIPGDSLLLSFRAVLDAELGIPNLLLRPVMAGEVRRLLPSLAKEVQRRRSIKIFDPLKRELIGAVGE